VRVMLCARRTWGSMMAGAVINVNEVIEGHVGLELDCLDRIYLNAYVNKLQVEGQVSLSGSLCKRDPRCC
jgi:hypothetical protein